MRCADLADLATLLDEGLDPAAEGPGGRSAQHAAIWREHPVGLELVLGPAAGCEAVAARMPAHQLADRVRRT